GIATQLLNRLLEHARSMGCKEAWVLTETDNQAAAALYQGIAAVENERPLYYSIRLDQLRSKN
ncbi:MAG: GNAT family N-acetyltransferase, partial [Calditrichaeota bacterium]|nr:GNAT family N-acetyltransferase [Calditrichota bacterium]